MRNVRAICSLLLLAACAGDEAVIGSHGGSWPDAHWNRVAPQSLGWSVEKLEEARTFFEQTSTDAVMVVHRGRVIAAWGDVARPMQIRSVRKALLDSLIGREVERGKLRLNATLEELGIDDEQRLTAGEKKATLHEVLSSSSAVFHPAAYAVSEERPPRGSRPRGTFFYNNWDFNVAGALYEKSAGRSIGEAFRTDIAVPIGMEDFRREHFAYRHDDDSRYPAYLFEMSARDVARFGLLYVRRGQWRDRRVLSESWIEASTRPYVKTQREGQSFGYLWWVTDDAFLSTGAGGQLLYVDPARDLVIVQLADSGMLLLRRKLGAFVSNGDRAAILERILAAAPRDGAQ